MKSGPLGPSGAGSGPKTVPATAALGVALAAVVGPTLLVTQVRPAPPAVVGSHTAPVAPRDEVPAVEPVRLAALTPDEARAYNAAIPFSTAPNPPARPFRFAGSVEDRERARDCLAAGVLYEAGDDAAGERAVAQVVLNRLRHPAFPKTICAVVFQGSEKRTGCQFTFSCDGALDRWHPGDAAWERARAVADAAMAGRVFRPVGYATHYHTDWVVPYWQASLDKVARVATHLFFRWSGWWGTPAAFRFLPHEAEPVVPALAEVSPAHRPAADPTSVPLPVAGDTPIAAAAGTPAPGPVFLATLPAAATPDQYPAIATAACAGHPYCKYLGWRDRAQVPAEIPTGDDLPAGLAFSYLRDPAIGYDKPLWNCRLAPRTGPGQCMRGTAAAPVSRPPVDASALGGVRRRSTPAQPLPSPTPAAGQPPPSDRLR